MHIMLVGLKQQLAAGNSVPMTLNFNGAPSVTLQVPVQAGGGHHHH
jgi:copper(I)-binding protein